MLLGFVVPVLFLAAAEFRRGLLTNFDMSLGRDAFNSVVFATLRDADRAGARLCDHSGLGMAARPRSGFVAMNIAQTGYALPGLVLALGLLTPVLAIDNGLNAFAGWLGRVAAGTYPGRLRRRRRDRLCDPVSGVPTGLIKAGFERIPRDYDDSARAAGAGQATTMRRIHLPLPRPAISVGSAWSSWIV